MKKRFIIVGVLLFAIGFHATATVTVNVVELKTMEPTNTFYTGELEAIEKGVLSFEEPGLLEYIAPVGTYVFTEIKDPETGHILREGTVIANQIHSRRENEHKAAVQERNIIEADFEAMERDYKRNKRLIAKNIVSEKVFSDSKTDFTNAKSKLEKATHDVEVKQYFLDRTTIRAPFTGVITKTLLQAGTRACDGRDAIEVTKMSPLLVKIPLPQNVADTINEGINIEVYPTCTEKLEPENVWVTTGTDNNMLYAYVNNKIIPTTTLTPEQENMKKVHRIFPVVPLSDFAEIISDVVDNTRMDIPLAVPEKAIRVDNNGEYVLKVNEDISDLSEFTVTKIYIKSGSIKRDYNIGIGRKEKILDIKATDSLIAGDLLIIQGDANIQDGETVVKENIRWKFLPEKEVQVSIPALSQPGIYVPSNTVLRHPEGGNSIYLIEDGKTKLTNIQITGYVDEHYCITGEGVKDGAQIVIIEDEKDLEMLYDGITVDIEEVLLASERITKQRIG